MFARVLEYDEATVRDHVAGRRQHGLGRDIVGRIQQYDVESGVRSRDRLTSERLERHVDTGADNNIPVGDPTAREVLFDERLRAAIALHERRAGGAAAERLDA